ncbi:MAG: hypothetical protein ACO4CG_12350 [Prochlorothrix sp.]|nr:hypothetical protein [Prochlorothrix sp.]
MSASPTGPELKFLLQLLAQPHYRSPLDRLKPSPKITAADRLRLCRKLAKRGWVDYQETLTQVSLAAPGQVLLNLDTTSLPVTPDELALLRACHRRSQRLDRLEVNHHTLPPLQAQGLAQGLVDRGLLSVAKTDISEVWLTPAGLQFLRDECQPKGSTLQVSGDLLGGYVAFLRQSLEMSTPAALPPVMPKPNRDQVLRVIEDLDRELNTGNYLPLFHLRAKLQPPLIRDELDQILYSLQRSDLIELGSVQEVGFYTPQQLQAGIPQNIGGALFFISVCQGSGPLR